MSREHEYPIPDDEITSDDLYPKGNVQNSHQYLFPKDNLQNRYPELYKKHKHLITRRGVLKKGVSTLLTITAFGATAYRAYGRYKGWLDFIQEELKPDANPEITTDSIFLPSLPNGYLEGTALIDFTTPLQIDTDSFQDRPFDLKEIDFLNRYRDVDVNRWFIVQNPFIDIRQDSEGDASGWITLIAYIDSKSQDSLTGGSYRGIYINLRPKDHQFADVPFLGKPHKLEESTPEQIVYNPDYEFIRSSDQKVIDGKTIGTISQNPKALDDFLKKIL
ncbi:MAG: hypothetical protein HYT11_03470 [Candidatus Levybacteria bacterium]|nr:hypothetical protein [Candidatus Levybacteria bacterium]